VRVAWAPDVVVWAFSFGYAAQVRVHELQVLRWQTILEVRHRDRGRDERRAESGWVWAGFCRF